MLRSSTQDLARPFSRVSFVTRTLCITLQAEPFLTVHMLCLLSAHKRVSKRGSARRVSMYLRPENFGVLRYKSALCRTRRVWWPTNVIRKEKDSNFLLNLRFKLNCNKTKTNLSPRPHECVLESIYFPLNENEANYFRSQ